MYVSEGGGAGDKKEGEEATKRISGKCKDEGRILDSRQAKTEIKNGEGELLEDIMGTMVWV